MKKGLKYGIIVFNILLIGFTLINASRNAASIKGEGFDVSYDEFKDLIDEGVTLVDIRKQEEHATARIPGEDNVNWLGNQFANKMSKYDKEKPIMIYCRSGVRSARAKKKLLKMGFMKVYNLQYGFLDWQKHGGKVESTPGYESHQATGEEGC